MTSCQSTFQEALIEFSRGLSEKENSAFSVLIENIKRNNRTEKFHELTNIKPEDILENQEELQIFYDLKNKKTEVVEEKYSTTHLTAVMKATRYCNLRCTYCNAWKSGPDQKMRFPVLARSIKDVLDLQGLKRVEFVWHGGETMLLPPNFYKKAIWLQQQFRKPGTIIENAMQTNATLLKDEWLTFLKDYEISLGVSLDGPPEVNDKRRVDKKGRPTSQLVKKSLQKLQNAGINYGILMVVDHEIVKIGPKRILDYLVNEVGTKGVAILNAIPENTSDPNILEGTYLPWNDFLAFFRELFSIWWNEYRNKINIRELDSLVGTIESNRKPTICIYAGDCMGEFITINPNGQINACDKYIEADEYYFGQLIEYRNLQSLFVASKNLEEAHHTEKRGVEKMKSCKWFNVCKGGCPHDRRLNERYTPGFTGECCGLSPLLEDINSAVSANKACDI